MTKKQFIALADKIRENRSTFTGPSIGMLADFCESVNPEFNRERWIEYIDGKKGPLGGKVKNKKPQENQQQPVAHPPGGFMAIDGDQWVYFSNRQDWMASQVRARAIERLSQSIRNNFRNNE